jgi:hypothetical protein
LDKIGVSMAGVLPVAHDLRTSWEFWRGCHAISGKGSPGNDVLRIFSGNHLAGDRLRVPGPGCVPGEGAIGLARSSYRVATPAAA